MIYSQLPFFSIPACDAQLDVVFAIDTSGSTGNSFLLQLRFVKAVAEGLNYAFGRTRVAAITYQSSIRIAFYLNTYTSKASIINALAFSTTGGRTNTADALRTINTDIFTYNKGDRAGMLLPLSYPTLF